MAIWKPKIATGLWCVGGIGSDNWRQGRDEVAKDVPYRMQTIADAGLQGYSGHVGSAYEFDTKNVEATNYFKTVKKAGDDLGLVCVDIVGSEFKTPRVREGSFTSEDPKVRQYALDNACVAGDLAKEWGVNVIRFWFGSDGKNGPFHHRDYDSIQRLKDGLLEFHGKYPDLTKSIEGKPGEPMNFQIIGSTGDGIAISQYLNGAVGAKQDKGRYVNPPFVIGPEFNHMVMNGEDMAHDLSIAVMLGVMGDLHACDGAFRVARDFDQQVGKWNPTLCAEALYALADGYRSGQYSSEWIILDQNTSNVPQGPQQVDQLRQSVDFIDASMALSRSINFKTQLEKARQTDDYTAIDRLVMGAVGNVMSNASKAHPVEI